jgi:hypothetical protein
MAILEVTSRQFRAKQKDIDNDDLYFTPEMLEKIDRSIQQAKEGKVTRISNIEELNKFLGL